MGAFCPCRRERTPFVGSRSSAGGPHCLQRKPFYWSFGREAHCERALHGAVGHERVETDAREAHHPHLGSNAPRAGQNLTLHLDRDLQAAAVAALGGRRGAVVALDPRTGGILALASTPSYDPNDFISGLDTKSYEALQQDPDQPFFNRSVGGQYAPGSTFKPLVALAALTEGSRTGAQPEGSCYYQLPGQSRKVSRLELDPGRWRRAGRRRSS